MQCVCVQLPCMQVQKALDALTLELQAVMTKSGSSARVVCVLNQRATLQPQTLILSPPLPMSQDGHSPSSLTPPYYSGVPKYMNLKSI